MGHRRRLFFVQCVLVIGPWGVAAPALGFVPEVRWGATAAEPAGGMGRPITLTWSILPDGTLIQGEGPSNFVAFLDGLFGAGVTGGDDLIHRPWFSLLAEPFDRWSELSGMTFVYEPADDGLVHGSADGSLGLRGDVRIGGAPVDGAGGTLAYIYYPSNSDLVIDTADGSFYGNPTLNYRQFRNTLMHELGHGFGLAHVVSNSDAFLMEPAINISFEGPQLDDIRGIHAYYGDALEKTNGGLGNDTIATATSLGLLKSGATLSIGAAAAPDMIVDPSDLDFVSISNSLDSDFFSFEVKRPAGLNAVLTPRGGVFNQGAQGGTQSQVDANADNDLQMNLFGSDGAVLASADISLAGEAETLSSVYLAAAGLYFVQVTGSSDAVQLYQLDLSLVAAASLLPGDYNRDAQVDAADYVVWRKSLAERGVGLAADANHDLLVDDADFVAWKRNFGAAAGSAAVAPTAITPEPATAMLALLAGVIAIGRRCVATAFCCVIAERNSTAGSRMNRNLLVGTVSSFCLFIATTDLTAADRVVATTSEFSAALAAAAPGDQILLRPGVYGGGHYRANLRQVTIRSLDPNSPAIIDGGGTAIQLSDAQHVTISDVVFRNQSLNGLNIDDGGSFATPSTDITLRNITVRDILTAGNHDGIKLSGVTGFLIDGVRVHNWGTGGSAVDMVGCHHGLIQNSLFTHTNTANIGTTLQPKGGSKDITFRANRIELPPDAGRAVQAGGSTGAEFFRFIDGDSGYEADEVVAEGNVIIGGSSAFSWVNIDGGVFHHNLAHRPFRWVARILNENQGNDIVDPRNGQFHDNRVVYNDVANELSTAVNVGPETVPSSYTFARNRWLNLANPTAAGSTPVLPTPETDGTYGDTSLADQINIAVVWDFPWGKWIVNANGAANSVEIASFQSLRRATPGDAAQFRPLEADPLVGKWNAAAIPTATIDLPAFSQAILIDLQACPNCLGMAGDYDGNGIVNDLDHDAWRAAFGSTNPAADGNGDGSVDAADYVVWRKALAQSAGFNNSANISVAIIPEPRAIALSCAAWVPGTVVLHRHFTARARLHTRTFSRAPASAQ